MWGAVVDMPVARRRADSTPSPCAAVGKGICVHLVAHADEVVAQFLDRVDSIASLDGLGVVSNEESLLGLADHNTLFALYQRVSETVTGV